MTTHFPPPPSRFAVGELDPAVMGEIVAFIEQSERPLRITSLCDEINNLLTELLSIETQMKSYNSELLALSVENYTPIEQKFKQSVTSHDKADRIRTTAREKQTELDKYVKNMPVSVDAALQTTINTANDNMNKIHRHYNEIYKYLEANDRMYNQALVSKQKKEAEAAAAAAAAAADAAKRVKEENNMQRIQKSADALKADVDLELQTIRDIVNEMKKRTNHTQENLILIEGEFNNITTSLTRISNLESEIQNCVSSANSARANFNQIEPSISDPWVENIRAIGNQAHFSHKSAEQLQIQAKSFQDDFKSKVPEEPAAETETPAEVPESGTGEPAAATATPGAVHESETEYHAAETATQDGEDESEEGEDDDSPNPADAADTSPENPDVPQANLSDASAVADTSGSEQNGSEQSGTQGEATQAEKVPTTAEGREQPDNQILSTFLQNEEGRTISDKLEVLKNRKVVNGWFDLLPQKLVYEKLKTAFESLPDAGTEGNGFLKYKYSRVTLCVQLAKQLNDILHTPEAKNELKDTKISEKVIFALHRYYYQNRDTDSRPLKAISCMMCAAFYYLFVTPTTQTSTSFWRLWSSASTSSDSEADKHKINLEKQTYSALAPVQWVQNLDSTNRTADDIKQELVECLQGTFSALIWICDSDDSDIDLAHICKEIVKQCDMKSNKDHFFEIMTYSAAAALDAVRQQKYVSSSDTSGTKQFDEYSIQILASIYMEFGFQHNQNLDNSKFDEMKTYLKNAYQSFQDDQFDAFLSKLELKIVNQTESAHPTTKNTLLAISALMTEARTILSQGTNISQDGIATVLIDLAEIQELIEKIDDETLNHSMKGKLDELSQQFNQLFSNASISGDDGDDSDSATSVEGIHFGYRPSARQKKLRVKTLQLTYIWTLFSYYFNGVANDQFFGKQTCTLDWVNQHTIKLHGIIKRFQLTLDEDELNKIEKDVNDSIKDFKTTFAGYEVKKDITFEWKPEAENNNFTNLKSLELEFDVKSKLTTNPSHLPINKIGDLPQNFSFEGKIMYEYWKALDTDDIEAKKITFAVKHKHDEKYYVNKFDEVKIHLDYRYPNEFQIKVKPTGNLVRMTTDQWKYVNEEFTDSEHINSFKFKKFGNHFKNKERCKLFAIICSMPVDDILNFDALATQVDKDSSNIDSTDALYLIQPAARFRINDPYTFEAHW